jgi:hypothetical protein
LSVESYEFNFAVFMEKFDPNNGSHLKELMFSKKYFVLAMWNHSHSGQKFNNFEALITFINMSKFLQTWYQATSKRYAYLHELPEWVLLDDKLRELWITDSSTIFSEHKKARKALVVERQRFIDSIEIELAEIARKERDLLETFYRKYPIVAISKIPVQGLPSNIFLSHSDKTGDALENALQRDLDNYKQELCLKYVSGNGDIKELIKLLGEIL